MLTCKSSHKQNCFCAPVIDGSVLRSNACGDRITKETSAKFESEGYVVL